MTPTTRIVPANALGGDLRDGMYRLFEIYYGGVSESRFRLDLEAKTDVILLSDGPRLVGFSTLDVRDFEWHGARETSIFSGDTIIDRPWWGSQQLSIAFCHFAGRVKARAPAQRLWWFLISKGHRTYRYLNAFARCFHPNPLQPTDPAMLARLEQLACDRFGDDFDRGRGVLRFREPTGHLKPCWQIESDGCRDTIWNRFFEASNPGFAQGDELLCLTELDAPNLKRFARSAFDAGLAERSGQAVQPPAGEGRVTRTPS